MSNKELLKNEKAVKVIMGMLVGAFAVLLMSVLFVTIKQGFNALMVIPLTILPIIMVNTNSLKEIKKEKKIRNLK